MNCRRCNHDRNVAHYFNDIFEGWFCVSCVDVLADAFVADAMRRERVKPAVPFGEEERA